MSTPAPVADHSGAGTAPATPPATATTPAAAPPAQPAPGATPATPATAPAAGTELPGASAQATAAPAAKAMVAMPVPRTTTAQVGVAPPAPRSPATAGSIGGALLALALVVGLILALGWLARRMPGALGAARGNSGLRVVATLPLGPRDRVMVVDVGGTQLLLGVGPGGTRTLHTLDTPLPAPAEPRPAPVFAQVLAQHFGKKA